MKTDTFWKQLQQYFTIYLPKQRDSSDCTISACHDAWNLLLRYISQEKHLEAISLKLDYFTSALIVEFLDHMDAEKHWEVSTRNQRLSCIRSFFKYASSKDVTANMVYADLCTIPLKKEEDKSHVVDFMSKEGLASIFASVDLMTRTGFRDYFFMSLMYDTAARDGEMLGMKLGDINVGNSTAYLFGKGAKPRIVPVTQENMVMFQRYKAKYHPDGIKTDPLFYTRHRGQKTFMSDDNAARIIKQYASKARESDSRVPVNVHPHMFRHSRAMHLYQGGMALAVLSEFLGHENPETTLIYAYADTEMKRKAIQSASDHTPIDSADKLEAIWKDPDIIGRLIQGY